MMNLKVYPTAFFLLFLLFFAVTFETNAQTTPRQSRKGKTHFLYVNTGDKVACTHDMHDVESAVSLRKNRPKITSTPSNRNPSNNLEATQGLATATFIVTYDAGFNANPAAKAAFQKAVDIWATLISSTVPIRINAAYESLPAGVLASTGPSEDIYPFTGSAPKSFYPTALIKSLEGYEVYFTTLFDIDVSFNSDELDFFLGLTGNPPFDKIDFVSTALHEIGHGLGFTGSGRSNDPDLPCDNTSKGCWGYDGSSPPDPVVIYPEIYDRFVENNAGSSILTLANPSAAVRTLILSNSLYFDSPIIRSVNGGLRARLYAPSVEEPGSTYSHFNENTYNSTANALMTPYLDYGEVQQNVGAMGCALLKTIGWNMSGACAAALPIELSNFQAANKGNRNILTWTTLTELNNKMFKIERSFDGKTFTEIGEVKGAGTTEFPRSYTFYDDGPLSISYYRLRQIDFDGKTKPSNIVSVSLNKNSNIALFPNPTKDKIAFNTTAFEPNRVVVYNNLGQIVMDKTYQINELDVSSLPTGLYVLELTSDNLKVNKRFVKN
jgi:Secretion system C-terminal sorting domain